jgi:hypothetical protein
MATKRSQLMNMSDEVCGVRFFFGKIKCMYGAVIVLSCMVSSFECTQIRYFVCK